jgi:hypothetical protein
MRVLVKVAQRPVMHTILEGNFSNLARAEVTNRSEPSESVEMSGQIDIFLQIPLPPT